MDTKRDFIGASDSLVVVGPGLMGLGIAQAAAAAGWVVYLLGRNPGAARAGLQRMGDQLQRQVQRGRVGTQVAQELLARVHAVADDAQLADSNLAIESVSEDRALKVDVLRRLETALPPQALIATNTSGLPVTGLAAALRRPERFLGLHFFSPADRMPLVEVVRGESTSAASLAAALGFVRRLGKRPVVVRDGPGFFTSRVFAAYLDEALALVQEGVPPDRIDRNGRSLGRAVGPLALLDDISLALNLQQIEQARADSLPPERCRPHGAPVLSAMVGAGRRGRRDGGGFYDLDDDGARRPWPGLDALFPPKPNAPKDGEIAARLRLAEVMEALRCLETGVVECADDADAASVLGLGFPAAQGGVLAWAESQGLERVVAEAQALAKVHGERFAATPWLVDRATRDQPLPRTNARP